MGAAIKKITRQAYLEHIKKNIRSPVQMHSTYGDVSVSLMENKSKFYYLTGEEAPNYDLSYSSSTGGLMSTSDDLVRFGLALTKEFS